MSNLSLKQLNNIILSNTICNYEWRNSKSSLSPTKVHFNHTNCSCNIHHFLAGCNWWPIFLVSSWTCTHLDCCSWHSNLLGLSRKTCLGSIKLYMKHSAFQRVSSIALNWIAAPSVLVIRHAYVCKAYFWEMITIPLLDWPL